VHGHRAVAQRVGREQLEPARAEALARDKVAPALDRQLAELTRLRARADDRAGVWKLPEGEAYYAWALRAGTTSNLTPDQVHAMGREQLASLGYFDPTDAKVTGERLLDHAWAIGWWWLEDHGDVTIDRDLISKMLTDAGDPRSEYWDLMRRETIPPDTVFAQRMVGLTFAVIGQLEATANWHRISREYIYDDPPATPLGEAEASFWPMRRAA